MVLVSFQRAVLVISIKNCRRFEISTISVITTDVASQTLISSQLIGVWPKPSIAPSVPPFYALSTRTSNDPEDPAVVCTKVFINAAYGEIVTQARQHPETLIITFIEELFHKHCVQVKQSIQAVALPADIAKILGATAGEPALRILRHYLDAKEQVLEISVSYHPGRRYAFNMTLGKNSR